MSKSQQLLVLDPPVELKFKGPFTEVVTSELRISNPSRKRICFKVKTTAPKQYCVRPNNGLIEPGASINIAVMLQPFHYDPNEKNRHKFLVQSLVIPDNISENIEMLWKDTPADQLMESKLKCVFDVDAELLQMKSDVGDAKRSEDCIKRELMQLREENAKLKDEGLRVRRGTGRVDGQSTFDRNSAAAVAVGQQASSPTVVSMAVVIMLALIALILGLIIGKFFL